MQLQCKDGVCSMGVEMDRKQHDDDGTKVIVLMYAMQH